MVAVVYGGRRYSVSSITLSLTSLVVWAAVAVVVVPGVVGLWVVVVVVVVVVGDGDGDGDGGRVPGETGDR